MPFSQYIPRPLIPGAIRTYAPLTSGVYGISNAREWIYIGQSDDIQNSLLVHLQNGDTELMKRQPTGFVFELCDRALRPARQDHLVREYKPVVTDQIQRTNGDNVRNPRQS